MNIFQIVSLGLLTVLAAAVVAGWVRRRLRPGTALAWLLLWSGAAAAIAEPGLTVVVAHRLGISRGADLVFYCAILAMLVGFFAVYLRLRQIDRTLTVIVRHIALEDAEAPEPAAGEPGSRG